MDYLVLAFYLIKSLDAPYQVIQAFKEFMQNHDMMGRIYVNEEGINAQVSLAASDALAFFDWYLGDTRFEDTDIKVQYYHEHVFPKKTVKYRQQLVALDIEVDTSNRGEYASAKEWKCMLDENDVNTLILDVRNNYEWHIGHFENAKKPICKTFREFPNSLRNLKEEYDPKKTRVLMYCTGGIRCEFYSCLMKEEGYEEVYQLEGGVIKYGQQIGNDHWKGNLFVFDDRLVISITDKKSLVIGKCCHCQTTIDSCYNCANMDCNVLFLACIECSRSYLGCCSSTCMKASRRRKATIQEKPKPFRKLSYEEKQKYLP